MQQSPIYEGLSALTRNEPLTQEDWLNLIEIRLGLMKEHLTEMHLQTLGDLKFVTGDCFSPLLRRYEPTLSEKSLFTLETKAIFPTKNDSRYSEIKITFTKFHRGKDDHKPPFAYAWTKTFWGFTECGNWITVDVYITRRDVQDPYKSDRYNIEEYRAKKVTITKCDPLAICAHTQCSLQDIWEQLEFAVKRWCGYKESAYQDAKRLVKIFEREEEALNTIPVSKE